MTTLCWTCTGSCARVNRRRLKRQKTCSQPYGKWILELFPMVYKKHPYRWLPIGSMEHLNAATEEDYQQFYRDFYTPNNAVLSIAGDIDIEQTKELVEKYFSTIPVKTKEIYRHLSTDFTDYSVSKSTLQTTITNYRKHWNPMTKIIYSQKRKTSNYKCF